MNTKNDEKDVGAVMELAPYIQSVIEQLKCEQKYAAVHGYLCALHSFEDFSGGRGVPLPMNEVFTPERLKDYEEWLLYKKEKTLRPNSVTGYMSSLRAVYNRWMPAGTPDHNPKMFADVHTRVVSQTKRALRGWQMNKLMRTDTGGLTANEKRVLGYFILMFLCRGIPFIDLAYLRRQDLQGKYLVYLRHKTKVPMCVELCPDALRLLREYQLRSSNSPYLFPILDAKVTDPYELCMCYQSALRYFNRTLARVMTRLLPGVRVSSYTARHTWATFAYHMGKSLGVISQSLGHTSCRVTETYLKPFENERLDKENRQLVSAVKKCKYKSNAFYDVL